jgi:choice-of-anchor C domain-containing protein
VKRRSGLGVALGFLAAIAVAGPAAAAFTTPTNPSFESGTFVDNGSGFQQLNAGDASIDGWSIGGNSIDWIATYWPAADGAMSIDLNGVDAGSLSQTFDTTIGNTYTVSFALSGNPAGPPTTKTLDVSATGATTAGYTYEATANDLTNMNWATEEYIFLATSASTTLTFTSTIAGAFGPALDNVVVTEFVPGKDDCKDGGWELMIDTSGNSFKNQGDCVSFFATKGKNLGAVAPVDPADASAATAADAATTQVKQSKEEKAAARAERQAAKDAARSQAGDHGSKSQKSKSNKPK